ncbi:MAG: glycine cleavage system protein GcvH [Candidatus Dormibacteria bacterium]
MPDLSAYRFTRTHEWVRREGEEAVVGITDHAQSQLGDVIFLELPAVGASVRSGARFGAVESVKAASDLISPVDGEVVAVNDQVASTPELVNRDPHNAGWLIRVRLTQEPASDLLDAAGYDSFARSETH